MFLDMHCDFLTAEKARHVSAEELKYSGRAQLFAAFVKEAAAEFTAAASRFEKTFSADGFCIVRTADGVREAVKKGSAACLLTCENIGFTGGESQKIKELKRRGVIMASLVWNTPNALAFPNVRPDGKRERRGLTKAGRTAVRALDENRIIIDISHLSDGGVREILQGRKIPVVASHSCCNALCKHPRNLTDGQLKAVADCGGAVGVNFYKKFLGGEGLGRIAEHILHIIRVAGEDTPAFGSDWDGVGENCAAALPEDMPALMERLTELKIPARTAEKIACGNFMRVLSDVCG